MMENGDVCSHIKSIENLKLPKEPVCEECMKAGGSWVHLRTCQTCGVTLCCDSSPQVHMTKHYHHTYHPVIISAEPGEKWLWCYPDEAFVDYQ
ncbi:UBP-type zinc finger domain-containing protein [Mucilaginibacter sp. AW1-3]